MSERRWVHARRADAAESLAFSLPLSLSSCVPLKGGARNGQTVSKILHPSRLKKMRLEECSIKHGSELNGADEKKIGGIGGREGGTEGFTYGCGSGGENTGEGRGGAGVSTLKWDIRNVGK